MLGTILRWFATAVRDWLNGYIDADWKVKQESLQRDAAALQRQHAETEKINTEKEQQVAAREKVIEQRDQEIEASQAGVIKRQEQRAERAKARESNEKPTKTIDEILGFTDKS